MRGEPTIVAPHVCINFDSSQIVGNRTPDSLASSSNCFAASLGLDMIMLDGFRCNNFKNDFPKNKFKIQKESRVYISRFTKKFSFRS
jgi:hypothetical protein